MPKTKEGISKISHPKPARKCNLKYVTADMKIVKSHAKCLAEAGQENVKHMEWISEDSNLNGVEYVTFRNGMQTEGHVINSVKFGSVTVGVHLPTKSEVTRNVKKSQFALARAIEKIVKPGVKISVSKGVPLFHTDSEQPGKIVRELNGRRTIGKFVEGEFIGNR